MGISFRQYGTQIPVMLKSSEQLPFHFSNIVENSLLQIHAPSVNDYWYFKELRFNHLGQILSISEM